MGNTEGSGTATPQNWYNPHAEYAISTANTPQRLVVSYVVNAPFGKGQKYFANVSNGVAERLISGWSVNGVTTYQEGLPLGLTAGYPSTMGRVVNIPSTYGGGSLRPNYIPGCTKTAGGSYVSHVLAATPVLNTACWSSPVASTDFTYNHTYYATTIGNESRVDSGVKAPGQANWDLAAQKATKITERVSLNFRFEVFNLFNRVQFGSPATTVPQSQGFGGSTQFGIINGSSLNENTPRQGQASLRLNF
jgi:hypothetical protein